MDETPVAVLDVEAAFRRILTKLLQQEGPGYSPWFYDYCGQYPVMSEEYVQYHRDLLTLAGSDVAGKRVLDVGCGFAPALIVYGLLGATQLCGIEIYEPMVETVRAFTPVLPNEIQDRLHVAVGSASDLPYARESVDIVLSNEAMSHYIDIDLFLGEAYRVLSPGGVLIISDSNNARNRARRNEVFDLWERFETEFQEPAKPGVDSDKSYALKRYEIIHSHFAEISDGQARELALRTAGLTRDAVADEVAAFVRSGQLPKRKYARGRVAVDPDGQVLERLLDPGALVGKLRAMGFRAKAYGYWGGAKGSRIVRVANHVLQVLTPLTIATTPSFRIVAVKTR